MAVVHLQLRGETAPVTGEIEGRLEESPADAPIAELGADVELLDPEHAAPSLQ
jgi:hypothetical protein